MGPSPKGSAPEPRAGWVLYDGDCGLCMDLVNRFGPALSRRGFGLEPLQAAWVAEALRIEPDRLLEEMRLLLPDGRVLGGAEALVAVARGFWWGRLLSPITRLPGAMRALRRIYREVAARRHCASSACPSRVSDSSSPAGGSATKGAP